MGEKKEKAKPALIKLSYMLEGYSYYFQKVAQLSILSVVLQKQAAYSL